MLLPLPNLDDRRWSDLVEEARALIPIYDKGWTDHNIHDPGIMLVELLAWLAEMDIYWLNRIPASRVRKFLALAGYPPAPPRPARAVLQILLQPQAAPLVVPGGFYFEGDDAQKQAVTFRSLHAITLAPGAIQAVQRRNGDRWTNLTPWLGRGEPFTPFGDDPQPGAAFYLGFSEPLPSSQAVSLYLSPLAACADPAARRRLAEEQWRRQRECAAPPGLIACPAPGQGDPAAESSDPNDEIFMPFAHHCVRLRWEYWDTTGRWRELAPVAPPGARPGSGPQELSGAAPAPAPGQVRDSTRALTLEGQVLVNVPGEMGRQALGQVREPCYYLRCTLHQGAFDAAPRLASLAFNGVLVEEAADLGVRSWTIAAAAPIEGPPPRPGHVVRIEAGFARNGEIDRLRFQADVGPELRLLAYHAPQAGQPARLDVEAETLERGDGRPFQVRTLAHPPVVADTLRLYTWEAGTWVAWQAADDLDAAGRADARFILDPTTGTLFFGDGEHGRALPLDALPLVTYRATRAEAGNLPAGAIQRYVAGPHNRALAGSLDPFHERTAAITNRLPAVGGSAAQTVDDASAQMLVALAATQRAVTLQDIEALAKETPGVCLARTHTIAGMHPAYPCLRAPGVVTLIILPYLPLARPRPSACLLQAVGAYLDSRRVLGMRIAVVGPQYATVAVQARVQASEGAGLAQVQRRVVTALDRFFHALEGGPDGTGWPFGRDVYRAEVLQVINETPGVDHVLTLDLLDADSTAQCGNLCIGPLGLVAAGAHQIEVV